MNGLEVAVELDTVSLQTRRTELNTDVPLGHSEVSALIAILTISLEFQLQRGNS